jgi:predicted O-linked N-acetylglucosamine transferase (SPINDLY family)
MATISELLAEARQCQRAGDVRRAEQIGRQILQVDPSNWEGLHLLGAALHASGRLAEAVDRYQEALRIDPNRAEVWNDLGAAQTMQGRMDGAEAAFRRALELDPNHAASHNNLGNALRLQGNPEEAVPRFREALRLRPDYADAHHNLGIALLQQLQVEEAIACFEQALRLKPDFAAALASLQRARQLDPNTPEFHNALGNVHAQAGRLDDAIAAYRHALRLKPSLAEILVNLGIALGRKGQLDEAIASFEEAVRLKPDYAGAHNHLGIHLCRKGLTDKAIASIQLALRLRPGYAQAYRNLGTALKDQGRIDEAIACYRRARELKPDDQILHTALLGSLHYHPRHDARAILEEHRRWEREHARPLARDTRPFANDPSPERPLRVGYVSPDFTSHVVGRNVWPLLRNHDRGQFPITLYANLSPGDAMTERFRQCGDRWRTIAGWTDDRVADQVRQDDIDILVDLALHTAGNRLLVFARKPAPVQVTFAGYPGTTGLSAIDYRLTDPYLDPPGEDGDRYAEQPYRLPHSFWCYAPQGDEPAVAPLPALDKGFVTFGCLNNFRKVNDQVLELWARVLGAVVGSQLLLLAKLGSHRQRTLDFLGRRGVAPERVEFVAPRPRPEYFALYHRADIGLDTFPYNGHTTSLDSFWMGVPVVTLLGRTVVGRAGLSQLTNLGLEELAAATPDDFVRLATDLAGDLPRLAALRAGHRERMLRSPLTDATGFARAIELAYQDMWRTWCCRRGTASEG